MPPKKSTVAETVAASAAQVMKGRSRKSAKEPKDKEEEGDPGESESDSSDEEPTWEPSLLSSTKRVRLPKIGAPVSWNDEDDYLAVLDHLQALKDGIERHMNSGGDDTNLWELCMFLTYGDSIKGVGKSDPDVLEEAEALLFEEASSAKLRLLKEFAAMIRETFEDNKEYTALIRGIASGVVMLNLVRAQHLRSSIDGSTTDRGDGGEIEGSPPEEKHDIEGVLQTVRKLGAHHQ
jgi:hypothetical protein